MIPSEVELRFAIAAAKHTEHRQAMACDRDCAGFRSRGDADAIQEENRRTRDCTGTLGKKAQGLSRSGGGESDGLLRPASKVAVGFNIR